MRRNLILALVLGAILTVAIAATSTTRGYARFCLFQSTTSEEEAGCPAFPNLNFKFDGGVTPKALPKHRMAPIALTLSAKVATEDGTHPSALRELTIDFDKNGTLNATGLPACGRSQLEARNTSAIQHVCRESIVGTGTAHVAIASSDQEPIPLPLTLFNGGVRDGITTLFIRSSITVSTPAPIIATVKLSKIHEGRYGLEAVAKIQPIAEGSGSLLEFSLKIKRLFTYKGTQESYAMARCLDGHLDADIKSAIFKNEAKAPGVASQTTLKGTVVRPCTPKG